MNLQDILEHFRLLSGQSEEEAAPWVRLCSRYMRVLRSRLRDPALEEKNAALLSAAAAEMAYAKYVELSAAREAESFSAGDITVRSFGEGALRAAKSVAEDAEVSVRHLLADQEFLFRKC